MSKHTPGPWTIGVPGPNGCPTIGTAQGLMTAMISHSYSEPEQVATARANARLIAAAPDLLEALERIARLKENTHSSGIQEMAEAIAISAIAKATKC